jgi:hypothetical protein
LPLPGCDAVKRLKNILIAFDQLFNAIFNGWPDETLSSRAWRWEASGKRDWARRWIDAVFALIGDIDHCRASYNSERLRAQLPPELRKE